MVVSDTFLENPNYSSFLLLETILVCGLFLIFVGEYKTLKDNGKKRKSLVKKSPFKLRRHAHGDLTQLHTIMFFRPVEMLPNVASGTFRKAGIGNYENFVHVDNEKIGISVIEFGFRIGKHGKSLASFLFQQSGSLMHIGNNRLRGLLSILCENKSVVPATSIANDMIISFLFITQ